LFLGHAISSPRFLSGHGARPELATSLSHCAGFAHAVREANLSAALCGKSLLGREAGLSDVQLNKEGQSGKAAQS
ncbi:hypothetical protein, partial [Rhodoblastus sp.]